MLRRRSGRVVVPLVLLLRLLLLSRGSGNGVSRPLLLLRGRERDESTSCGCSDSPDGSGGVGSNCCGVGTAVGHRGVKRVKRRERQRERKTKKSAKEKLEIFVCLFFNFLSLSLFVRKKSCKCAFFISPETASSGTSRAKGSVRNARKRGGETKRNKDRKRRGRRKNS